jgi:hypothetical protein
MHVGTYFMCITESDSVICDARRNLFYVYNVIWTPVLMELIGLVISWNLILLFKSFG